jgi:hypothetical protein
MNKTRTTAAAKQHTYGLKGRAKKSAFDKLGENATLSEIQNAVADGAMAELEERVNDVRDSWETDSLFEDVFAELGSDDVKADDDGEFLAQSLFTASVVDVTAFLRSDGRAVVSTSWISKHNPSLHVGNG